MKNTVICIGRQYGSGGFKIAKMLSEKKVYNDIVKATGASTATISRVNRSLQYGADGYEKIFERVEE